MSVRDNDAQNVFVHVIEYRPPKSAELVWRAVRTRAPCFCRFRLRPVQSFDVQRRHFESAATLQRCLQFLVSRTYGKSLVSITGLRFPERCHRQRRRGSYHDTVVDNRSMQFALKVNF